jgi:hypothetical protein
MCPQSSFLWHHKLSTQGPGRGLSFGHLLPGVSPVPVTGSLFPVADSIMPGTQDSVSQLCVLKKVIEYLTTSISSFLKLVYLVTTPKAADELGDDLQRVCSVWPECSRCLISTGLLFSYLAFTPCFVTEGHATRCMLFVRTEDNTVERVLKNKLSLPSQTF